MNARSCKQRFEAAIISAVGEQGLPQSRKRQGKKTYEHEICPNNRPFILDLGWGTMAGSELFHT
jgi:hypothetical protein